MATKPPKDNPLSRIPTRKLAANLKRELRQILKDKQKQEKSSKSLKD
ncbi:MAG: hypothetical protein ABSG13_07835 [Bryobacteraceae bacterium]